MSRKMMAHVRFVFSKAMRRLRPPALRRCTIDKRARVLANSDLTCVVIGRYTYCGYGCQIVECEIGAFCSISDNVTIGRAEHNVDAVSTSPVFQAGRNVFPQFRRTSV